MTFEKCTLCGKCNTVDISHRLSMEEGSSPRHAVWMMLHERPEPFLFNVLLSGHAQAVCPVDVEIEAGVIAGRRMLVGQGITTAENKKFFEKLEKGKNPFK